MKQEIMKDQNIKRFIAGIVIIILSTVIGWSALIIGGIQSITSFVKIDTHDTLFHILMTNVFIQIYFASWFLFFVGFLMSGPIGWKMWKQWLAFIFQQEKKNVNSGREKTEVYKENSE